MSLPQGIFLHEMKFLVPANPVNTGSNNVHKGGKDDMGGKPQHIR